MDKQARHAASGQKFHGNIVIHKNNGTHGSISKPKKTSGGGGSGSGGGSGGGGHGNILDGITSALPTIF